MEIVWERVDYMEAAYSRELFDAHIKAKELYEKYIWCTKCSTKEESEKIFEQYVKIMNCGSENFLIEQLEDFYKKSREERIKFLENKYAEHISGKLTTIEFLPYNALKINSGWQLAFFQMLLPWEREQFFSKSLEERTGEFEKWRAEAFSSDSKWLKKRELGEYCCCYMSHTQWNSWKRQMYGELSVPDDWEYKGCAIKLTKRLGGNPYDIARYHTLLRYMLQRFEDSQVYIKYTNRWEERCNPQPEKDIINYSVTPREKYFVNKHYDLDDGTVTIAYIIGMIVFIIFKQGWLIDIFLTIWYICFLFRVPIRQAIWYRSHPETKFFRQDAPKNSFQYKYTLYTRGTEIMMWYHKEMKPAVVYEIDPKSIKVKCEGNDVTIMKDVIYKAVCEITKPVYYEGIKYYPKDEMVR